MATLTSIWYWARSEEGTKDGRGLSMIIYDKRNGGVNVRRIENKMGIKGSPTCELVFKNAKAELCGDRKLVFDQICNALMNGARLGIMAQAVGLARLPNVRLMLTPWIVNSLVSLSSSSRHR